MSEKDFDTGWSAAIEEYRRTMRKAGYDQEHRERLAEKLHRIAGNTRSTHDRETLEQAAAFIGGTEFTLALLMDDGNETTPAATTDDKAHWQMAKWRAEDEDRV